MPVRDRKNRTPGPDAMDTNPKCIPYGEPKYWDWRYEREREAKGLEHTYDWYMGFDELWPVIETYAGYNLGYKARPSLNVVAL